MQRRKYDAQYKAVPHDLLSLCAHLTPRVQPPCSIFSFSEGGRGKGGRWQGQMERRRRKGIKIGGEWYDGKDEKIKTFSKSCDKIIIWGKWWVILRNVGIIKNTEQAVLVKR